MTSRAGHRHRKCVFKETAMQRMFNEFLGDDEGAVAVDWLVLNADILGVQV